MRTLPLLIAALGLATNVLARGSQDPYVELINHSGISDLLNNAPADITRAATRHAARCQSTALLNSITPEDLTHALVTRLNWQHTRQEARQLVTWFQSAIGEKVKTLEAQQISEQDFQQHQTTNRRFEKIEQIYRNTATESLIPQLAVEIEYSGWLLSGCMEKAEATGNIETQHAEMTRAHAIKQEATALEELFREDTLLSMAYLLSPLSLKELNQYADSTQQSAQLYSALVSSLVGAVRAESKQITISSLR